ncbi:MAG TPA: formyltransferase family protein [Pseudolabrys sp.]
MLRTIFILAPGAQQQFALAALLRAHNPDLSFVPISSAEDLAAIEGPALRDGRLISFASGTIVPAAVLDRLGYGAYNFHPGPAAYPGWAPAHFALYDRARTFGATAHLMIERVDAGPIIDTEMFIVPHNISVRGLEQMTYVRMAYLFWRLARKLATQTEPLQTLPIKWGERRSTKRLYASMCDIPAEITKAELARRIAAFHDDFRGIVPTVMLHGVRFQAVPTPVASEPENHSSAPRETVEGLGPLTAPCLSRKRL